MNKPSVANNLRSGRTPSGKSICEWIDEPRDQNYVYAVIEDLFEKIYGIGFEFHHDDSEHKKNEQIERVIAALRADINNAVHDEDIGMFGVNGQQLFVNPRLSYSLLLSETDDTEEGLAGFLRTYDLPSDTAFKLVIACAAMLDLDEALDQVKNGDICRAVWIIYGVTEVASAIEAIWDGEYRKEQQSKVASERGKAAHKETNEFKKKVIEAWSLAACRT